MAYANSINDLPLLELVGVPRWSTLTVAYARWQTDRDGLQPEWQRGDHRWVIATADVEDSVGDAGERPS
jgi:hypothetical protein